MNEKYLEMIEDCEDYEDDLTDWERKFLDDIKGELSLGNDLTERQVAKLEEIWSRVV